MKEEKEKAVGPGTSLNYMVCYKITRPAVFGEFPASSFFSPLGDGKRVQVLGDAISSFYNLNNYMF